MKSPLIVVVEDDPEQAGLIRDVLTDEGFSPRICENARALHALIETEKPALVLLDLGLPDEDGYSVAAWIRAIHGIPIIMLTGRGSEFDRVMGLEIGADDYLVKPFSLREMMARVRAVLRRSASAPAPVSPTRELQEGDRFPGWTLDMRRRRLLDPGGQIVALTVGEFGLLTALVSAHGRRLSRSQLLDMTRRSQDFVHERTIDALIVRLRRKLEPDPEGLRIIGTERGYGYVFIAPVEVVKAR